MFWYTSDKLYNYSNKSYIGDWNECNCYTSLEPSLDNTQLLFTLTIFGKVKDNPLIGNDNIPWDNIRENIECIIIVGHITFTKECKLFSNYPRLLYIIGLDNLDTSNVRDMSEMFYNCFNLRWLDLTNFNTSNVITMKMMFSRCDKLSELNLINFDTHNVTNMSKMFNNCHELTKLNLSSFDTSNVRDMKMMFVYCSSLSKLDLFNFNTSNVKDINNMFNGCRKLTELNLSNFDTSNVRDMYRMFYNCSSLIKLDLSNFTFIGNVLIESCNNLESIRVPTDINIKQIFSKFS